MAAIEIPRPSIIGNLQDEAQMTIDNVSDPQALRLLARVLSEKSALATDKAEAREAARG